MSDQPNNNGDKPTEAMPEQKSRRGWPRWVSVLLAMAVALCVCIGVLTLFGPAIGNVFGNIVGVPNDGGE